VRDIYIPADRDFVAFTDVFNAKDHNRNQLSYLRTFTYAPHRNENFAGQSSEAH
jgi:hypothetical protein